jgi:hypothetical protein
VSVTALGEFHVWTFQEEGEEEMAAHMCVASVTALGELYVWSFQEEEEEDVADQRCVDWWHSTWELNLQSGPSRRKRRRRRGPRCVYRVSQHLEKLQSGKT